MGCSICFSTLKEIMNNSNVAYRGKKTTSFVSNNWTQASRHAPEEALYVIYTSVIKAAQNKLNPFISLYVSFQAYFSSILFELESIQGTLCSKVFHSLLLEMVILTSTIFKSDRTLKRTTLKTLTRHSFYVISTQFSFLE